MPIKTLLSSCEVCSLKNGCRNPKINPYGGGGKRILVVGEAPGKQEDMQGIPFVGLSGRKLKGNLRRAGINLDRDCVRTNIVQCFPGESPVNFDQARRCWERLEKQIEEFGPNLIIALGGKAVSFLLDELCGYSVGGISITSLRGKVVPVRKLDCWMLCEFHPAYLLRQQDPVLDKLMVRDFGKAVERMKDPLPGLLDPKGVEVIKTVNRAEEVFDEMYERGVSLSVSFDYETTALSPFGEGADILGVGFADDVDSGYFLPFLLGRWSAKDYKRIEELWKEFLSSDFVFVVQHQMFERVWSMVKFGVNPDIELDTILLAHIRDERRGIKGLGFQVFSKYGDTYKGRMDRKTIASETLESVAEYCCLDARYTLRLAGDYLSAMDGEDIRAYGVLQNSAPALAEMTVNGVRIDLDVMSQISDEVLEKRESIFKQLMSSHLLIPFTRTTGKEFNPASSQNISVLIYKIHGLVPAKVTPKGEPSSSKTALAQQLLDENLDEDMREFIGLILQYKKMSKMESTYTTSLIKMADQGGILHPNFLLHSTETYRSSSTEPNIQQVPKRDEALSFVRKAFVPRNDWLLACDLKGAEIRVIAMYSGDRILIKQLNDGRDLHAYWASRLFKKPERKVTEDERYTGKNGFVFPLLYGSFYKTIAPTIGMDEAHIRQVEEEFWGTYSGVKAWQEQILSEYRESLEVKTAFGFRRRAPLSRRQVINSPIQATSFHFLLKLAPVILDGMGRRGLRSKMITEIHDEILFDAFDGELEAIIEIGNAAIAVPQLPDQPVSMGWEWSVGKNWLEMQEI